MNEPLTFGPLVFSAGHGGAVGNPRSTTGFSNRNTFPVKCDKNIVSFVVVLGLARRPYVVSFVVPKVVLKTFDRMVSRRFQAHVMKKSRKVAPFVANGDSAPAVIGVADAARVQATGDHTDPRVVFRGSVTSRVAVTNDCAAAPLGLVMFQRRASHFPLCPAIATTDPVTQPPVEMREREHGPQAVSSANEVFWYTIGSQRILLQGSRVRVSAMLQAPADPNYTSVGLA